MSQGDCHGAASSCRPGARRSARHYSRRTEDATLLIRRFIVFHGRRIPASLARLRSRRFSRGWPWNAGGIDTEPSAKRRAVSSRGAASGHRRGRATYMGADTVEGAGGAESVRATGADQLTGVPRIVATPLYGAGLRLQECLELRVKDLDFERREITVRRGKGQKDRRVMLPDALRKALEEHLEGVRRLHHADLAAGFGRVVLPGALDRKYSNAATDWSWQFVFPAGRICRDERFGPPKRFHLHESVI